jgi:S-ribosylhomocysteine lyase LuxS involved in autoinducer biosynthesis
MTTTTPYLRVELLSKHSSGKDHLAMTGGTLGADKRISGSGPLRLQQDFFPVTAVVAAEPGPARDRLFAGIHSIEHALASPDGGDLRARLAEATAAEASGLGTQLAARLIDMSPYIPGLLDTADAAGLPLGFRSTFVLLSGNDAGGRADAGVSVDAGTGAGTDGDATVATTASAADGDANPSLGALSTSTLLAAYRAALAVIREKFLAGEPVPFSTPEACGQYNLHSAQAALELIEPALAAAASPADLVESFADTGATELYVCDLRLVKPRLPEAFDQQVLDLLGGHVLSQQIEQDAPNLTAGNFGCSTGEYLMVANPQGLERDALLGRAHREVAGTLAESGAYTGPNPLRAAAAVDARFSLEHIERYSPASLSG